MLTESVPFTDLTAMTRDIRPAVDRAWADLLDSSRFVGGEAVEEFERAWASYCGVRMRSAWAMGPTPCADSYGLGVGIGDEVVVPANTFIASAEAVVLAGAAPCSRMSARILCCSRPRSWKRPSPRGLRR